MKSERFLLPAGGSRVGTGFGCEPAGASERARPCRCRALVGREHTLEAVECFAAVAAIQVPERNERSRETKRELRITGRLDPIERGSEVALLGAETLEPLLRAPCQVRLRFLSEGNEPVGVPPLQFLGLARLLEPLPRVLADRLEHPVARPELRLALA